MAKPSKVRSWASVAGGRGVVASPLDFRTW